MPQISGRDSVTDLPPGREAASHGVPCEPPKLQGRKKGSDFAGHDVQSGDVLVPTFAFEVTHVAKHKFSRAKQTHRSLNSRVNCVTINDA